MKLHGFLGSIATRTIGDACKYIPVKLGQNNVEDNVADLRTKFSKEPIATILPLNQK